MKLSQAMRDGAQVSEHVVGAFIDSGMKSCALGAAAIGLSLHEGALADWETYDSWLDRKRDLLSMDVEDGCPGDGSERCYYEDTDLRTLVMHLNDDHRWTREEIADWVEDIENEHEACELHARLSMGGGYVVP